MTRLTSLAAIGVIGLALCGACGADAAEKTARIRPVRYIVVEKTGGQQARTFSGISEAGEVTQLSFKVGGNISKLPINVGARVSKGDLIAQLDETDFELQVRQATASQASASAQLRSSKASYERVLALYQSKNATRADMDAARSAYDTARANASAAAQQTKLVKQQRKYTRLVAPVDGSVAEVLVAVNENVAAGALVAKLNSGDRPKVIVAVPEAFIAAVEQGADVVVSFDATGDTVHTAVVSEVGVTAGATATYPVTVILTAASDSVRPGMAAEVAFQFGTADERPRYYVPSHCVGEDTSGRFVWVVTPSDDGFGAVTRRQVTVGEFTASGFEITEGLSEGDRVIDAGVSRMQEAMRVRLPPEAS